MKGIKTNICFMLKINDVKSEEEYEWASKVGTKALHHFVKFANPIFIPVYNKVWDILYPNTKDFMEEHPNYDKIYGRVANIITSVSVFFNGGFDLRNKRIVKVNVMYNLKPQEGTDVYLVDDMISIKRLGS